MAYRNLMNRVVGALLGSLLFVSSSLALIVPHHSFSVNNNGSSAECLSCHDGSVVHSIPYCSVNCGYRDPHIIDTPYPPPGKQEEYRPPEFAALAGIRFSNGSVTCTSCHNLINPGRYHLAMSNEGSRLCLACHLM